MKPPDFPVKGYFSDGKNGSQMSCLAKDCTESYRQSKDLSTYHLSPHSAVSPRSSQSYFKYLCCICRLTGRAASQTLKSGNVVDYKDTC